MYINETKLKVRYVETDQMGIVHHSNYYAYFEVGRTEFITAIGMTYKEMEKDNIMLPVVESSCKYIEGAKYEDIIIIQTFMKELNGVKVIFNYNVVRAEDGKILAKGSTTHAFVNEKFRVVNLRKVNIDMWSKLKKLFEE
ncbi:acyl-CoA thioesterase [Clostridium estertheticum]|uniref:Acyl-CoA thioesterase n=2 Tax=Clostridium estertheticum TaxID=238834 RepID=A0AA47I5L9_9CLOT|nr:thioesterase family protein [Clostridium estertheticum]MBU3156160.1 acyl-CoA thioesterase [Clostridium estertheticum]MBU3177363.1 acyl-CoA thioesterase [Clostridium estertheticum]WAG58599.1 acyl-CoA thioesterase [Clostridium estertheticum]